jgi:hypothetical protein
MILIVPSFSIKQMDTLSFRVPVLGSSYVMFIDFIKFSFKDDYIVFYCHTNNEPMVGTLYKTRKNHTEILNFIQDHKNPPLLIERINKYKHEVSFEKKTENLQFVLSMLQSLFPNEKISIETTLYNDYYTFGKCDFHLLDLYEIGHMSLVSVDFDNHWFNRHNPKIFTGLLLIARNPFYRYHYDFIELDFFNNLRNDFLRFSFDTLIQDRPSMKPKLSTIITEMVSSIPLKEEAHTRINTDWKHYNDMDIRMTDLNIKLKDWKPSYFLKCLSKLLDMFPSYYINPKFNIDISK